MFFIRNIVEFIIAFPFVVQEIATTFRRQKRAIWYLIGFSRRVESATVRLRPPVQLSHSTPWTARFFWNRILCVCEIALSPAACKLLFLSLVVYAYIYSMYVCMCMQFIFVSLYEKSGAC